MIFLNKVMLFRSEVYLPAKTLSLKISSSSRVLKIRGLPFAKVGLFLSGDYQRSIA